MPMIDALKLIIQQEDKLMQQPFTAVCRILHLNYLFHQLDQNIIINLVRKRFLLMCIEAQCSKTKLGPQHLIIIRQQLYDIIFDTFCDIPQKNSFRPVNIDYKQLKEFLSTFYESFILTVNKLSMEIGVDHSNILPGEIVSFILHLLTTIPIHDRPMKLYTDFALKYREVRENMQIQWPDLIKMVDKHVFGTYHSPSKILLTSYAINLGRFSCPSKLFFFTEPLWDMNMNNQRINLTTLANQLKAKLDQKLTEWYGNSTPNASSAHTMLHSIVASVLEEYHDTNAETITAPMIMDCMIKIGQTAGRKGNIYSEHVFPLVVLTIEDYLKFRKTTPNMTIASNNMKSRSYEYKVLAELLTIGMNYDKITNEIDFDESRLKVPRIINLTESKLDFNDLKREVQELYRKTKAIDNSLVTQTCLNIEIKDFVEFGYKMDAQTLLPIWELEQKNIVSSIVTDIDQIDQPIRYVAGLDISFVKTNDKAVAAMVIFDYETLNIVAKISINCYMKIPYIPTYLAFREAPVFMKLIDILKENCPELTPQVILIDGSGVWHPRRAGIASHFGVLSGIPCFGVTKNVLNADGITFEIVEDLLKKQAPEENQYVEIIGDSGAVLGLAYNITGFVKNAVYISAGHKITLKTACDIFKNVTKYRITEPIRQADLLSRELVAKLA
ncbi:unnamed protein product [Rotaria sp. Silwood1]|nr:unnamed protein product [Rotaria sp. Silwood1]CAF1689263.1 unnamed protein product [Rotaria sp. Silwood1]